MKKLGKLLGYFLLSLLAITVLDLLFPRVLSINLKDYDPEKYQVALKINKHPLFTKGDVEFLVRFGPLSWMRTHTVLRIYPRTIFLNEGALKYNGFGVTVAHELGHLQSEHLESGYFLKSTEKMETEAEAFVANIYGKEELKRIRSSQGLSENHYLMKKLED